MAGERRVSGIMETKPKGIFPLREGQRREGELFNNKRWGPGPRNWNRKTGSYRDPKARAYERLLCGPKWGYDSPWSVNIGG